MIEHLDLEDLAGANQIARNFDVGLARRGIPAGMIVMWSARLCAVRRWWRYFRGKSKGERRVVQGTNLLDGSSAHASVRTLKIEAEGDSWKGSIRPKIRLMGHWLERAGFSPGHRVHVTCVARGLKTR